MRRLWLVVPLVFVSAAPDHAAERAPNTEQVENRRSSTAAQIRHVRLRLNDAAELLAVGRVSAAIGMLQAVLDDPESRLAPWKPGQKYSAGAAALEMISSHPKALVVYRTQYGEMADRLLNEAIVANDTPGIAKVSQRYFLTIAGFDATNRLASVHLDQGNFEAALLYLDQLVRSSAHRGRFDETMQAKRAVALALAGRAQEARASLARSTTVNISLGGMARDPASLLSEATGVLERTGADTKRMDGRPAAYGESIQGDIDRLNDRVKQFKTVEESLYGRPIQPGAEPIVVGDVVCCRYFEEVFAIHARTGKRLWKGKGGRHFVREREEAGAYLTANEEKGAWQRWPLHIRTIGMTIANSVLGRLTSDGTRVYRIDYSAENGKRLFGEPGCYWITAMDSKTGRDIWRFGSVGPRSTSLSVNDRFFFGPPVPIRGKLFVVAEDHDGYSDLICLDPSNGQPLWSQLLGRSSNEIKPDPMRWWQACDIQEAGGMLVMITPWDEVIAFDMVRRQIAWRYSAAEDKSSVRDILSQAAPSPAVLQIVGGLVLTAPACSSGLHAIELYSGHRIWRADRGPDTRLLASNNGQAILQNRNSVQAIRVRDGRSQWLYSMADIAGKGYITANRYHVPATDGTVHTIDLVTGNRQSVSPMGQPKRFGSLIATPHGIHFVHLAGIECFPYQQTVREELARLTRFPKDSRGLYRRAQQLQLEGNSGAAFPDAVQAVMCSSGSDRERCGRLLLAVGRSLQDSDIESAGASLEQFGRVARDDLERSLFHQLSARRFMIVKDYRRAALAFAELGCLPLSSPVVTEDRITLQHATPWSQRFLNNWSLRNLREVRAFQQGVEEALISLAREKRTKQIGSLVRSCRLLSFRDQTCAAAAVALMNAGDFKEAEATALRAAQSDKAVIAFHGTRTLDLIAQKNQLEVDGAAVWKRFARQRLLDSWGESELPLPSPVTRLWFEPVPTIRSSKGPRVRLTVGAPDGSGKSETYLAPPATALPSVRQRFGVVRRDGIFVRFELWNKSTGAMEFAMDLPRLDEGDELDSAFHAFGHRIVFRYGRSLVGLSLIDPRDHWMREIETGNNEQIRIVATGPGFLAIQTDVRLRMLDPYTGDELWSKFRFDSTERVFSDNHAIVLCQSYSQFEAYRTSDGRFLRSSKLPKNLNSHSVGDLGSTTLITEFVAHHGGAGLARWDLWTRQDMWKRAFPMGSYFFTSDPDSILVVDMTGKLWAVHRPTGADLVSEDLGKDGKQIESARVYSDDTQRYVFFSNLTRKPSYVARLRWSSMPVYPLNGLLRVYDKSTGTLAWTKTLEDRLVMTPPDIGFPFLVCFGATKADNGNENGGMSVTVLDKANGQTLGSLSLTKPLDHPSWRFDPKASWLEVFDRKQSIRIQLD